MKHLGWSPLPSQGLYLKKKMQTKGKTNGLNLEMAFDMWNSESSHIHNLKNKLRCCFCTSSYILKKKEKKEEQIRTKQFIYKRTHQLKNLIK